MTSFFYMHYKIASKFGKHSKPYKAYYNKQLNKEDLYWKYSAQLMKTCEREMTDFMHIFFNRACSYNFLLKS